MEEYVITIEDSVLKRRAESLINKGDVVFSLTSPTVESPFPLWIWKDVIKLYNRDKWINIGNYRGDNKDIRMGNGKIRIKE